MSVINCNLAKTINGMRYVQNPGHKINKWDEMCSKPTPESNKSDEYILEQDVHSSSIALRSF